jgi:hypothetical protein
MAQEGNEKGKGRNKGELILQIEHLMIWSEEKVTRQLDCALMRSF